VFTDTVFLVSGGADTFTYLWPADGPYGAPRRVASFRGEIVCIAISQEFHLVVSGSGDGALLFIVPETGVVTRVCAVEPQGAVPKMALITAEWGFVVVASEKEGETFVTVYSVNGELVRNKRVNAPIVAWASWKDNSGFDFLVMADARGAVFVCEVFDLDCKEITQVEAIRAVFVAPDDRVIALIQKNKVKFISYPEIGLLAPR
jgi:hypothetical protein